MQGPGFSPQWGKKRGEEGGGKREGEGRGGGGGGDGEGGGESNYDIGKWIKPVCGNPSTLIVLILQGSNSQTIGKKS